MERRAALALLGAAGVAPRAAVAQNLTPVALAGVPEDSITAALVAQQNGLFHRYGLDVTLHAERSGPAIAAGVAGGGYQIGKSSITPLIQAHVKGLPFVLIAAGGVYVAAAPIDGLIVRADSGITSAAGMNGKSLAVYGIGDFPTIATELWVEKNGGDPSTLKLVEVPISAMVPAIESGRVDAGTMNEPALQIALSNPKLRMLARPGTAVAPRYIYTVWFTTAAWASANKPAVAGFARAMREASIFGNTHQDQTAPLIAAFTGVDIAVIRKMTRVTLGTALDPTLIQPVIDAMAKFKAIPAPFDARELIATDLHA
jgi:NitT/TauT family transport system substrate-binding protein